jgi:hypothetical protein
LGEDAVEVELVHGGEVGRRGLNGLGGEDELEFGVD